MADQSRKSEGLKEIPADEILAKIKKGEPIEYDHVIIKGNLAISRLNLPKENEKFLISFPIKIIYSQIEGNINFSKTIFRKEVNFSGSQFFKLTSFDGSIFAAKADFGNSQYSGDVSFNKTQFDDDVSFHRSEFLGIANFSNSQFNKEVYFRKSQFSKDLVFNRSYFKGDAYFKESTFNGEADYKKSQFHKDADFSQSQFLGSIADFESAQFLGDVFFDDAFFKEKLSLSRTKYGKLYIRWKNITRSRYQWKILENWRRICHLAYEEDHGEDTYLLLIDNFKKLGFFEDADDCYYHYRNERRRELPGLYKPADWTLMALYGYGVKPIRPLRWARFFFCAFGIAYAIFGGAIGFTGTVHPVDALNTSYTLLLSGTKLIDDPNHATSEMLYFIFTLEKLLGSLFFALFLVSIGRTIVR